MPEIEITGVGRVYLTPAELLEMARLANANGEVLVSASGSSAPSQPEKPTAVHDTQQDDAPAPSAIQIPGAHSAQVGHTNGEVTLASRDDARREQGIPSVAQMTAVWDKFRKDSMRTAVWYFVDHGPRVNTDQAAKTLKVKAMSGVMSAFSKACTNAGGFDVRRLYKLSGPTLVLTPGLHALLKDTLAVVDPDGLYRLPAGTDLSPSAKVDAGA